MNLSPELSKSGYYNVYENGGDRVIVLEGLSVNDTHNAVGLESFMLNHYPIFEVFYWGLLSAVFIACLIKICFHFYGAKQV